MYYRDLETNREAKAQYDKIQKETAAKRLADIAAKLKLKRQAKQ